MKDIREMNQNERRILMNQVFDSGHFKQEIFELLLKCPLKTISELNQVLSSNPNYYPKYIKNKNLSMIDIYYNIITDLDQILIEGWDLGPTQKQIYSHLNKLIYNEEILRKAEIISKILEGLCPNNDTDMMKPLIYPYTESHDNIFNITWEENHNQEPYKFDGDHWTKDISIMIERSLHIHKGQRVYLYISRDNMEIDFLTDLYFDNNKIPKLSNGIYEGAEAHEHDDNLFIYWD